MPSTASWSLGASSILLLCACAQPGPAPATGFSNSLGMAFVRIPAGQFTMGTSASTEALRALYPGVDGQRLRGLDDERPAHAVRITRHFYLGRHEVTVGQFRAFLERSGHVPESIADGTGGYGWNPAYDPATTARGDAFEGRDPRYSWRNPGFAQGDEHPVVNVTWNDAQALAQWLSRTEGRRYRLPTEAEWEYACRAGQSGAEPTPASLQGAANVFDRDAAVHWPKWAGQAFAFSDGFAFTAPVGSFAPNAFGVYDMVGNVWEWTADWHADDYYAHAPLDDTQGPADGEVKVRRGGSWHTWPLYARCGFRNWNTPETRYTLVGIRLVLEAP
ncbi:formylglycine-generating enzyme family protein [Pseudorhodoferax sp. Leaf274]|uniref:formylglycine-generating enzyme family protein n=1 Tax=Pseudorhodoferax sp. Leaf274 TaxID=1736318 RepID=UPI00070262A4|nr:formylglycine-generating enzyme family protein [Pseudorhodoferax sp. Leaf274]KQP38829.1 DNA recombination protein RecF [Pseudorhodoferax sp. Leaf274]